MKRVLVTAIFMTAALYAEKADVLDAKIEKSYGGSYIAYVKIRHHEVDFNDFVSEWEIEDQNGVPLTRKLEVGPKPGKEVFESDLIGFRIPEGTTKLIFKAKCSKDGFGGKEFIIDLSSQESNVSQTHH